jgi:Flp pilus assembly protein TadB
MASNFTDADVITAIGGVVGAFAVWRTAKRSENILEKQKLNKEQHREQFEQNQKQHTEHLKLSEAQ